MGATGYWAERFASEIEARGSLEDVLKRVTFLHLPKDIAEVVDLSLCAEMPELKELVIHCCRVEGVSALSDAPKLRSLVIGAPAFNEPHLEAISASGSVAALHLNGMILSELSALSRMPKLKDLTLHQVTGVDAAAVAELGQLTAVRLSDGDYGDLGPLGHMPRLRTLTLEDVHAGSLDFLRAKNLVSFTCKTRVPDEAALTCLAGRTKLRELDYPLANLSVVAGCTSLTSVSVDASANPDLSPLAGLPITSFQVYFARSEAHAQAVIAQAHSVLPSLIATGYRVDWSDGDAPRPEKPVPQPDTPEPQPAPVEEASMQVGFFERLLRGRR